MEQIERLSEQNEKTIKKVRFASQDERGTCIESSQRDTFPDETNIGKPPATEIDGDLETILTQT